MQRGIYRSVLCMIILALLSFVGLGRYGGEGLDIGKVAPGQPLEMMGGIDGIGYFTENKGQWSPELLFVAETSFGRIGLGEACIYFDTITEMERKVGGADGPKEGPIIPEALNMESRLRGHVVKYVFENANDVEPEGVEVLPHYTNYFLGNDETRWASNVRSYKNVIYRGLWDSIDLIYKFGGAGPKYDLILYEGARAEDIRIRVEGQDRIESKGGDLRILSKGTMVMGDIGLIAFTEGSTTPANYRLISSDVFGFALPEWDGLKTVVIDPMIISTYIGGSNSDYGYDVATDDEGNVILFGSTYSNDFPTVPGSYDTTLSGTTNLIVSKLDQTGSSLMFSTYLGGSSYDYYYYYGGMKVANGGIYVTSITSSSNFPTTSGCYDDGLTGFYDCTVSKLSLDGTELLASTYFGGSNYEYSYGLASSREGGIYLLGTTYSTDLPITPDAYQELLSGTSDCFAARLTGDLDGLEMSTFLGGSGTADYPQRIMEDEFGDFYVVGSAASADFPVTAGSYDTTNAGTGDCFVAWFEGDGNDLKAGTFIGGTAYDVPHGLALDLDGQVLMFGYTLSSQYPVTPGVLQSTYMGGGDSFVTRMKADLSDITTSTFHGGSGDDSPVSILVDSMGSVILTGSTKSSNMATTPDADDSTFNGNQDFFLSILPSDLSKQDFSTFYGGSGAESGGEAFLDPFGKLLVAGRTNSTNMPVNGDAYQKTKKGSAYYTDLFVFGRAHLKVLEPTKVDSVKVCTAPDYLAEGRYFDLGESFYIELRGTDANATTKDMARVNLTLASGTIANRTVALVETQKDSGIYRGSSIVPLGAKYFDVIDIRSWKDPARWTKVVIDYRFRPIAVSSLTVHLDLQSTETVDKVDLDQTVFIKAEGIDSNPFSMDKAFVNLSSDKNISFGPLIVLFEDGLNTGSYTGTYKVPRTMSYFENITLRSVESPSTWTRFMVHTPLEIRSSADCTKAKEDVLYQVRFWNFGYETETWDVSESAEWLSWELPTRTLSGTPDNLEVGAWDVLIRISDSNGRNDTLVFAIDVENSPPSMINEDVLTAIEDELYYVDYNSDDDGQGVVEWHLSTNAGFLSMSKETGVLSGRPVNEDVGTYEVNIQVKDEHMGMSTRGFNLTVVNKNDMPMITTMDVKTVMQDDEYRRDYEATDPDVDDHLNWTLRTDADWLMMDPGTGLLNGTPRAWDVGVYLVNITVTDTGGLSDHREFSLEVLDEKDTPFWVDVPEDIEIFHGERYYFDVNASDYDAADQIEYSIRSKPESSISIEPMSGMVDWTVDIRSLAIPAETMEVTLRVTDGTLFNTHTFNMRILPTRSPSSTLVLPAKDSKTPSGQSHLEWTGSDPEDDPITYTVYLSQSETYVSTLRDEAIAIKDIQETYYDATGLEEGKVYFWSIIPFDTCTYGECTSGVWSFKVNSKPVLNGPTGQKAMVGKEFELKVTCTDADADDQLTFSLGAHPEGMGIDPATGTISWKPDSGQEGENPVAVSVTDGTETVQVGFTVDVSPAEKSGALSLTVLLIAGTFLVMLATIIVLVFLLLRKREKELPVREEDAEEVLKDIERSRREKEWEKAHERPGESHVMEPVPISAMEAHAIDHARKEGLGYDDLYGKKSEEEGSESELDRLIKKARKVKEEESWEE